MGSERECCCRDTSISSKCCQSGREVELARAATADPTWGERLGRRPSIFPTNSWEQEEEAGKAAGAWSEALLRFIPQRLLGREAFSHDHSERGQPRMTSSVSLTATQNPWLPVQCSWEDWWGGCTKIWGEQGMSAGGWSPIESLACHAMLLKTP